jgi:hypothetical protein
MVTTLPMLGCQGPHYQNAHRVLSCRGISNDKLGNYDAAIADFDDVVALEPNNVNALFSRGFSKDNKGMTGI